MRQRFPYNRHFKARKIVVKKMLGGRRRWEGRLPASSAPTPAHIRQGFGCFFCLPPPLPPPPLFIQRMSGTRSLYFPVNALRKRGTPRSQTLLHLVYLTHPKLLNTKAVEETTNRLPPTPSPDKKQTLQSTTVTRGYDLRILPPYSVVNSSKVYAWSRGDRWSTMAHVPVSAKEKPPSAKKQ